MTKGKKKTEEEINQEAAAMENMAESTMSTAVTADLSAEVSKLQGELAEANDKILRAHAEFDNFRKRSFKDISNARAMAQIDTVLPFLNLFDNVNMAVSSAEGSGNIDAILQGLRMIVGEYDRAISDIGIKKFNALGEKFDPALHEAIAHENSSEVPEGIVTKQWNCGYKLGERLLRPARVVVSSGPEIK